MNTINEQIMEKFLDGTASTEEISALEEMLRTSEEARHEILVQAGMESQLRLIFAQAQAEAAQTPVVAPSFWRSNRWLWIPAAAAAAAVVWFAVQPSAVSKTAATKPVVAQVAPIIKPAAKVVEVATSTPITPVAPVVVAATDTGSESKHEQPVAVTHENPAVANEIKEMDEVMVAKVAPPQPPVVARPAPVAPPVVPAPVVAAVNQPANPVVMATLSDVPFSNSSGAAPQSFHPFNDATVASLYSGTKVIASQNGQNQQINLASGAVRLQVAKMAPGSQLSVRTPLLTAYVRGTDFVVVNKGASCWVADRSGSVDVVPVGTNNVSIHVAPGHCVKVTADSQPEVLPTTSTVWINQSRSVLGTVPYP
jgi:ferric-dicitrate binding protein FerR (iron transport regulator)